MIRLPDEQQSWIVVVCKRGVLRAIELITPQWIAWFLEDALIDVIELEGSCFTRKPESTEDFHSMPGKTDLPSTSV